MITPEQSAAYNESKGLVLGEQWCEPGAETPVQGLAQAPEDEECE